MVAWSDTNMNADRIAVMSVISKFIVLRLFAKKKQNNEFWYGLKKVPNKKNSPFIISSLLSSRVKGTPSVSHFSRSNEKKISA